MKATAHANINVALTKYWGKRDKKLHLPQNGSVSVTFNNYGTTTTVEFSDKYKNDSFILDGDDLTEGKEFSRVVKSLDLIREKANISLKAKVISHNKVITAAGLASSASGGAALVAAATKAAGLQLSPEEVSILTRRNSGSATRSIMGGFVEWVKGEKANGFDSVAKQVVDENYWPEFRIIATIINTNQKKVKSRAGMEQTVNTCPFYDGWLKEAQRDIDTVKQAIKDKNFSKLGEISEYSTLKMHSMMMTTKPAIIYWDPATLAVIHSIIQWRSEGLKSYFTMDAGPQVKVFCLQKDVKKLQQKIENIPGVKQTIVCKIGKGIEYIDNHLF